MKKAMMLTALLGLVFLTTAGAQDLDQILDSHFRAVGQKQLKNINTLQTAGQADMMGMQAGFAMKAKKPDKVRVVIDFQGAEIIQAYDGQQAWAINPMTGSAVAMDLSGADADNMKERADMDGPLWNYKEKGHQLSLDGSGQANGHECHILKLDKSNGTTDLYYVDKESYLIHELRTSTLMNGSQVEVVAQMSDYRDVNGYKMPFRIEQQAMGQTFMTIQLEEAEVNAELDDSIFSKPGGN